MKLTKHRETRTTHYRTWKSGKKWIYSASMLAAILGSTALSTGVNIQVAMADTAVTEEVAPATSTDTPEATATSETPAETPEVAETSDTPTKTPEPNTAVDMTAESAEATAEASETNTTTDNTPATEDKTTSETAVETDEPTQSSAPTTLSTPSTFAATAETAFQTPNLLAASTSTGTLTASRTEINESFASIKLTLTVTGNKGDVITVSVPYSSFTKTNIASNVTAVTLGTTTATTKNGVKTFSFTLDTDGTAQTTLSIGVSGGGMIQETKQVSDDITWAINGEAQTPITLTQTVGVRTRISNGVIRYAPDVSTTKEVTTGVDYLYGFYGDYSPEFADGSTQGVTYVELPTSSTAINNQITIPTPPGFELNVDMSKQLLGIKGASTATITQAGVGEPIIINTNGSNLTATSTAKYGSLYAFAGHYVDGTSGTVTANSKISMHSNITTSGDYAVDATVTSGVKAMSETVVDPKYDFEGVNLGSQGIPNGELLLDDNVENDPYIVGKIGFKDNANVDLTDTKINIKVPDGLNVTGITTPALTTNSSEYMGRTQSFTVTLTGADGSTTTITGVKGNQTVATTSGSPIRNAVFAPDFLPAGAYTATPNPASPQSANKDMFVLHGNLSQTYDNGTPVKEGDKLVTTLSLISETATSATGKTSFINLDSTQTVVTTPKIFVQGSQSQNNRNVGVSNAASTAIGSARYTQENYGDGLTSKSTAYRLYEPIYYMIGAEDFIPNTTSISGTVMVDGKAVDISTIKPTITKTQLENGRWLVTVDFTGTNAWVSTNTAGVSQSWDSDANAIAKTTKTFIAVAPSQVTKEQIVNPTTDSNYNSSWIDNPNAVLVAVNSWTLETSEMLNNPTAIQGNIDTSMTAAGTSDERGSQDVDFTSGLRNTFKRENNNVKGLINLPDEANGDALTLKLTGPVTLTYSDSTKVGTPQVYYSTKAQTVTSTTAGTQPSLDGYVTADQVTDWSTIKSVIIATDKLQPNAMITGDFPLVDENVLNEAGKSVTIKPQLFADSLIPTNTSVTYKVQGKSTVTSQFHYVDAAGKDQIIPIPTTDTTMTQTLNDNVDKLADHYSDESLISAAAKALIPEGYEFVNKSQTIIDNTKETSADGAAELGGTSKYFYDGDIVQMELQPIIKEVGTETQEVTRTIHYRYLNPEKVTDYDASLDTTQVADDNIQTVTFTRPKYENQVTKEITYGPWTADATGEENGQFTAVTSPDAPLPENLLFIPDQAQVASASVAAEDPDSEITVYYDGPAQTARVIYWDESTGKQLEVSDDLLGLSDQPDKSGYTTAATISKYEKMGYELVKDDEYKVGFTYDSNLDEDQVFNVYLKPRVVPLTPENPGTPGQPVDPSDPNSPNYPDGDYKALEDTVLETIHYVYEDGSKAADDHTDEVKFTRTGTVNLVTGEIVYGDWTAVNDDNTFDSVISPLISGYTADTLVVGAVTNKALDPDTEITVVYKPVFTPPVTPETPDTPEVPITPETPEVPVGPTPPETNITTNIVTGDTPPGLIDTPEEPTEPVPDDLDTPLITSVDYPIIQNASGQKALPETGDETPTIVSSLGGALIALAGLLGLNKRRKHDN